MSKLQEVTERIWILLMDTELATGCIYIESSLIPCNKIREAEVLAALCTLSDTYRIYGNGDIVWGYDDYGPKWQLGKPISEQSEETINFLHEILVK